jgi:hypothetical protein
VVQAVFVRSGMAIPAPTTQALGANSATETLAPPDRRVGLRARRSSLGGPLPERAGRAELVDPRARRHRADRWGDKLEHLEDALPGEQLVLSEAEISRLEESYVPRAIVWQA